METKRVWILGAGFSLPLGAPLFKEIYSETLQQQVDVIASRKISRPYLRSLRRCYRHGAISLYRAGYKKHWHDPEQFLRRFSDFVEHTQADPLEEWVKKELVFPPPDISRRQVNVLRFAMQKARIAVPGKPNSAYLAENVTHPIQAAWQRCMAV